MRECTAIEIEEVEVSALAADADGAADPLGFGLVRLCFCTPYSAWLSMRHVIHW